MNGNLMGTGYLGEVRSGPDGQLYQWVEGIDGLGNPIGFWKALRRRLRGAVRRLAPLAQRAAGFLPGPYGAIASRAISTASPWLQRAGLLGEAGIGQLYEAPDGSVYQVQGLEDDPAMEGLGEEDLSAAMGMGALGEVRTGPDGNLYQWVNGVDGLGNPVGGFWSRLRRLARRGLPLIQRAAGFVPGWGTAVSAGLRTAAPYLQRAGLAQDEAINGLAAEEMDGFGEEETMQGLGEDEVAGLEQSYPADTMQGLGRYVPPEGSTVSPVQPIHFTALW